MKSTIFKILISLASVLLVFTSCTETQDENQEAYGYMQFKLYKNELPDHLSKSTSDGKLDYMYQAKRMKVSLSYKGVVINQSVDLSAYDADAAEFGLRSEKIKLLAGDYAIKSITLYDIAEKELFVKDYADQNATVKVGALEMVNLVVESTAKGFAKFSFGKSLPEVTRAENTEGLLLVDVAYVDLELTNAATLEKHSIDTLQVSYKLNIESDLYQSGYLRSDSLCRMEAGKWFVSGYKLKSKQKTVLASASSLSADYSENFEVEDNLTTEFQFNVKIDEESEQIKDYKALKAIWEALDGPNWSYHGEAHPNGTNWNFNCDIDQWGQQPGVALHPNGRVASLNISEFGFRGAMPEDLGQLTELYELYLGTHNDKNVGAFDPKATTIEGRAIDGSLNAMRFELAKKNSEEMHGSGFANTVSPLLRRAYTLRGVAVPEGLPISDDDIANADKAYYSGIEKNTTVIQRSDTQHGQICNGLTSLPDVFDNLKKLQVVFIANGLITDLPESFSRLESLTDLELYNCSKMTQFPQELSVLPNLISVNISANKQWTVDSIYEGYKKLGEYEATKPKATIQILYAVGNSLEEIPAEFNNLVAMGLMDLSNNNIKKVHQMRKLQPVILNLSNNKIEELPFGFCNMVDMETLTISHNKLKSFPNIFNNGSYRIETINLSYNDIASVDGAEDGTFRGVNVKMLNLQGNELKTFPAIFATSNSQITQLNVARNKITEIEEGAFSGKHSSLITSLDFSANQLNTISPSEFSATTLPYLYGVDFSFNRMEQFPWAVLNSSELTVLYVRGQRDAAGQRCLEEWPNNIAMHKGLRGLYLGSNNLGVIEDKISYLIFHLEISDNPNIVFDASGICYYIQAGVYNLYYDLNQDIRNCPALGIIE